MKASTLRRTVICPGCGAVLSLQAVENNGGSCVTCGYRNDRLPNRLLTVGEMLEARNTTWDSVNIGAVLRAYENLLAQDR